MFLVDSARQDRADAGLLPYATFVAFFPHLIAGPIVRPKDIIPQLQQRDLARPARRQPRRRPDDVPARPGQEAGAGRHLRRLRRYRLQRRRRTAPSLSLFEAWYAVLAYSLQIYFDFSGYSDMAIGLARMLNVRFPLNFDSPYQARNIAEFWRRWHITLGAFLRDYLYIPLGGSRCGALRHSGNLLVTMLLCGLWHGAAWRFVLWGGLHGLYLVLHAHWRRDAARARSPRR